MLLSRPVVVALVLFSMSILSASAQRLPAAMIKQLDSIALQDVPARAPGIATAVIQNGVCVYEKYGGYADFADSSLIGPNTRFNIASNGKQFTALAILDLIDKGKLRLQDDVRTYLPSLFTTLSAPITIEHLLTHTSGIRDVYDLWSLQGLTWWKQSFSNADVLALLNRQSALNFVPGSQFLYSNSNYILLAMIGEKSSGLSFGALTRKLFDALGMYHTSFEPDYTRIQGPIARAYFNFDSWTTYPWTWNVCGDGNLFTTLRDQVRWEQIIQETISIPIKKEIIRASQQPVNATLTRAYGYGLEFGAYRGEPYRFHEGATGAWKATVLRFPSKNLSLITLTNTGKSIPSMQTRQMADRLMLLRADASYQTSPAGVGAYVSEADVAGIYLTENNFSFRFELENKTLVLKRSGRNDIVLEREAANLFHQKNDPAFKQEFNKTATGELQVTAYYTTHAPYSLVRPNVSWQGFREETWTGTFLNEETGVAITIENKGEKNYLIKNGETTFNGILVSPEKLLAGNYTLFLQNRETILLDGERIKKVVFRRKS